MDLAAHLADVHPSKYGTMLDGVSTVCLEDVRTVSDQAVALRLVVLADRMYDRDLPVVASGVTFDELFAPELLRGGYRKKYFRAISRLVALSREGAGLTDAEDAPALLTGDPDPGPAPASAGSRCDRLRRG